MTALGTDAAAAAFLRTADVIGLRLIKEAIWHEDYCNWLGAEPVGESRRRGESGLVYHALGPDLYSGTSGVALFLAELYAATGSPAARRTALGAIRQALSRADDISPSVRLGLYTGWFGVSLVAARLGMALGEEQLLENAAQLLHRASLEDTGDHEFDLLSGSAGGVAALVVLQDMLDDTSLLYFAVRLADELLEAADKTDAGYSWKSVHFPDHPNLTGFSHGTAGVGYALLELFKATGDSKYRVGAERAFQYERHWFDAEARNWPDFREVPLRRKLSKGSLSFATYWCHGAPGIALSRLRAFEVLEEKTYRDEAVVALGTTRAAVEADLHYGENFSLCHGLAGSAEVLLYGSRILGHERAGDSLLALQVANSGIDTYMRRGLSWPCGTGGGETPSLMLGLAGIGLFYLRLNAPAARSVLILPREKLQKETR